MTKSKQGEERGLLLQFTTLSLHSITERSLSKNPGQAKTPVPTTVSNYMTLKSIAAENEVKGKWIRFLTLAASSQLQDSLNLCFLVCEHGNSKSSVQVEGT